MTPGTKLGPLPAWAWGLVLLGGLGLGLYLRRGSKSSPTASLVSAGGPVASLGAAGGGSDGGAVGVSTGMDPVLASLLADSNSALVSESGYFAGLAGQSLDTASQALFASFGFAGTVMDHYTSQPPVIVIGSSPAGSSPAGTSTPISPQPREPVVVPLPPYSPPPVLSTPTLYARQGPTQPTLVPGTSTIRRPGAQLE